MVHATQSKHAIDDFMQVQLCADFFVAKFGLRTVNESHDPNENSTNSIQ